MTSLTIDIAEVKTMSKQLNNGAKIVQSQLVIAGREAGMIFIGAAQSAAPVDIGNLRVDRPTSYFRIERSNRQNLDPLPVRRLGA